MVNFFTFLTKLFFRSTSIQTKLFSLVSGIYLVIFEGVSFSGISKRSSLQKSPQVKASHFIDSLGF